MKKWEFIVITVLLMACTAASIYYFYFRPSAQRCITYYNKDATQILYKTCE